MVLLGLRTLLPVCHCLVLLLLCGPTVARGQGHLENANTAPSNAEVAALISLYDATDGEHWVCSDGWLSETPPCPGGSWNGVRCDEELPDHVSAIVLPGNNLTGVLPPGLFASFTRLVRIDLARNGISGKWGEVGPFGTALEEIMVSHNAFTGEIPLELAQLPLRRLSLRDNAFIGSIPNELGGDRLEYLDVASNSLHGFVPEFLVEPPEYTVDLSDNFLWCPVPAWCGMYGPPRTLKKCLPCVPPPHGTEVPAYLQGSTTGAADPESVGVEATETEMVYGDAASHAPAVSSITSSLRARHSVRFSLSAAEIVGIVIVGGALLVLCAVGVVMVARAIRMRIKRAEQQGYLRLSHLDLDYDESSDATGE